MRWVLNESLFTPSKKMVALEFSLNIYFAMHGLVCELCCSKYN